ncbi:MAG: hypothetical protein H6618_02555 [Deltaproteobacteria bacterium]|nr:hypothetical protein [Deltaproteobacteria bacterium]
MRQKQTIQQFLIISLLLYGTQNCSQTKSTNESKIAQKSSRTTTDSLKNNTININKKSPDLQKNDSGSSEETSYKAVDEQAIYFDINRATAVIDPAVSLGTSGIIDGMNVPRISIKLGTADHVQMLRCAASYRDKMITNTGESIQDLSDDPYNRKKLEWVWAQAKEDRNHCKIVGTNIVMELYPDLTAAKGEYFYIINPCISKERSLTQKEGCSNQLSMTDTIKVNNSLTQALQEKAAELAIAESSLTATFQNTIFLARKIEIHLRACENKVANDRQILGFKQGLVQLGFLTVGGALGSFFGPSMAVMGATLASQMGSQLLFAYVLNWPPYLANECIDPNVVAAAEAQSTEAGATEYVSKYESEFQVQTMTRKLQAILDPENGALALASQRVTKLLEEMQKLDINVLTVDQAKARASSQGIDIYDPATFSSSNTESSNNPLQDLLLPGVF